MLPAMAAACSAVLPSSPRWWTPPGPTSTSAAAAAARPLKQAQIRGLSVPGAAAGRLPGGTASSRRSSRRSWPLRAAAVLRVVEVCGGSFEAATGDTMCGTALRSCRHERAPHPCGAPGGSVLVQARSGGLAQHLQQLILRTGGGMLRRAAGRCRGSFSGVDRQGGAHLRHTSLNCGNQLRHVRKMRALCAQGSGLPGTGTMLRPSCTRPLSGRALAAAPFTCRAVGSTITIAPQQAPARLLSLALGACALAAGGATARH